MKIGYCLMVSVGANPAFVLAMSQHWLCVQSCHNPLFVQTWRAFATSALPCCLTTLP